MENFVSHLGMGQKQMAERHSSSGGEHKSKAAMSALTLLAFLFFLHILQQCIKDHMTAMSTSPIMIMSAGKEGNEVLEKTRLKLDKTVKIDTETDKNEAESVDKEKHLTKISTYHPLGNVHKYRDNTEFSKFVNAMDQK
ncbi:unnamed protein product [Pieris brassicae]|uniref:Uncharacterized protein n=1 Tax=Pieris brassicae TaxID=7116 RepID=A0A9P0TT74_PIEBR|nr:unnamed protein product [Pieris brassicae]